MTGIMEFLNRSDFEFKRGNYKESTRLIKKYLVIKDSLLTKENMELSKELNTKYESEKKDKELAEQNLQIEKQESELQKRKSQNILVMGLAIFLLLTTVLTWFLYQQRQKRKDQEIIALKREQQVKNMESFDGRRRKRTYAHCQRIARWGKCRSIRYKI